jgi:beta-glucosidase-like glycosyl hydrolase
VPSCANKWLLTDTLRDAWKFDGYVSSDSGAVVDVFTNHHYTHNWTSTVAATLSAGCDVESAPWPRNHAYGTGGPCIHALARTRHKRRAADPRPGSHPAQATCC